MAEPVFNPAQNAFLVGLRELQAAEKKLAELAKDLPPLPADAEGDEFEFVEPGYLRTETVTIDIDKGGQTFHAYTDGWDSMSEDGAATYINIDGLPYAVPDDLDWD